MTLINDRVEIEALCARLAYNLDFGNGAAYADDYTPDGSFEVRGIPEEAEHKGLHSGRDELIHFIDTLYSGTQGHVRHWHHNFVFTDVQPARIEMVSYLQVLRVGQAPQSGVILTGLYYDTLVKQNGRWLLHRRLVECDPQEDTVPTDVLVVRRDQHVGL